MNQCASLYAKKTWSNRHNVPHILDPSLIVHFAVVMFENNTFHFNCTPSSGYFYEELFVLLFYRECGSNPEPAYIILPIIFKPLRSPPFIITRLVLRIQSLTFSCTARGIPGQCLLERDTCALCCLILSLV